MRRDNAKGVLIIPEWRSAVYWPMLCAYSHGAFHFSDFVKDWFYLSQSSAMFLPGYGSSRSFSDNSSVFSGTPKFRVLALKIDFST